MIELSIGFILGVILITLLKSSSMSDYEKTIEELSNKLENQNIEAGIEIQRLKRINNVLRADNERLKNAFVWKVDK